MRMCVYRCAYAKPVCSGATESMNDYVTVYAPNMYVYMVYHYITLYVRCTAGPMCALHIQIATRP